VTTVQSDPSLLDSIVSVLKNNQSFCLSGHQGPDADVVGSQLAMRQLLLSLDPKKSVSIYNSGPPPKHLSHLPGYEKVQNTDKVKGQFDVAIVFECSGMDRMGNIIDFKTQAKNVVNIDHHLHNPNFGTLNFVEPLTSSTAEMIYKIYIHSGLTLTKEVAMCLYTGLVADTGWFRYGNTNSQTHAIASHLVEEGVPVSDLAERMYMSRSAASMALIAHILSHVNYFFKDQVALLTLPLSLYKQVGATGDDLEELVNMGLLRKSVLASVLLKEKEASALVKVSLRSKGEWDINQVARMFNGGGHRNASGCAIEGSLETAQKKILNELEKIFS